MRFAETEVAGAMRVDPAVHRDARGFFLESFHAEKYAAAGLPALFVQDNHSRSTGGTLRGLHMQILKPQGKLVRVIEGEIWDVALDVRPESPTFMKWTAETLSAENFRQLYIPPGCAHGFCVTSEVAQVQYKCTELYDPADEIAIAWNDPAAAIPWPIREPLLSARDQAARPLKEVLAIVADRRGGRLKAAHGRAG
jgi:dTDP-4-dehydrorhamnose 3,5-epimerase